MKQKYRKIAVRILITLICVAMLGAAFTSCTAGDDKNEDGKKDETTTATPAENTTAASDNTTPSANTTESVTDNQKLDDLPDELTFGGTKVNFLAWNQSTAEYTGENDGNIVNEALYFRNINVEERLKVQLEFTLLDGNSSSFESFCNTAQTSINTRDGTYDAIACYSRSAGVLTLRGLLADLTETEYLNFDQPWWTQSLRDTCLIADNLYFMSGDIATSLLYQMTFMIVNRNMLDELNLQNPQELVGDGNWTLNRLITMCDNVYIDNDNSSTKNVEDRYGVVVSNHPLLDLFFFGSGMKYIETDTDGNMRLWDGYFTNNTYDIVERLNNLFWTGNNGIYSKDFKTEVMAQGTSLFYVVTGSIISTSIFRDADFTYHILPSPKYNAKQEDYYSALGFPHSMYCIPTDAKDFDKSSATLECLAAESYRRVTPALFENSFKSRYSTTPVDSEMFELVRDSVAFDIVRCFFDKLGGDTSSPIRVLRKQVETNRATLASQNEQYKEQWQTIIDEMNTTLANID